MCDSLMELSANEAARTRAKAWKATPASLDVEWLLKDITAISKGRFAQRLATRLGGKLCPRYILEAIKYVAERCS
jgi:putative ATP-dependent endonuclease of the OLD family